MIMKITEVKKKDGTVIYRASIYLGTDKVTGKKVTTKITGRTKKEVREKAKQEAIEFIKKWFYSLQSYFRNKLSGTCNLMVG